VSAVDDLRRLVLTGGDGSLQSAAIMELADRIDRLEARVFPAPPLPSDPVAVAAEPVPTIRPELESAQQDSIQAVAVPQPGAA
jgi:hypothetical protein